jgi:hypothetical protein
MAPAQGVEGQEVRACRNLHAGQEAPGLLDELLGGRGFGKLRVAGGQVLRELACAGVGADAQDFDLPALFLDGLGVFQELVGELAVPRVIAAGRWCLLNAVGDQQQVLSAVLLGQLGQLGSQDVQRVADVGEAAVPDQAGDGLFGLLFVGVPRYAHGHRDFGFAVESHHQEVVPGNQ